MSNNAVKVKMEHEWGLYAISGLQLSIQIVELPMIVIETSSASTNTATISIT